MKKRPGRRRSPTSSDSSVSPDRSRSSRRKRISRRRRTGHRSTSESTSSSDRSHRCSRRCDHKYTRRRSRSRGKRSHRSTSHYTPPPPKKRYIAIPTPKLSCGGTEMNHTIQRNKPIDHNTASTSDHNPTEQMDKTLDIKLKDTSIQCFAKIYSIENTDKTNINAQNFLDLCTPLILKTLKTEMETNHSVKYQLFLETLHIHPSGEVEPTVNNFKCSMKPLFKTTSEKDTLDAIKNDYTNILTELDEFEGKKSGWTLYEVLELQLRISKCSMFHSLGCKYVELPKSIKRRQAVINVKNSDDFCFKYAIISKLYTGTASTVDVDIIKQIEHGYNFNSLLFPMNIKDVIQFEKCNPDTSVNVFILESDNNIYPARIVDESPDHFDLLFIPNDKQSGHFAYIKSFNTLIRPQMTPKSRNALVICKRCYSHKRASETSHPLDWLDEHARYCNTFRPAMITLPKKGSTMKFRNSQHHVKVPCAVYLDLESTLRPISDCMLDPEKLSYQRVQHLHETNSACMLVKSTLPQNMLDSYNISTQPILERGDNALHTILEKIISLAKNISKLYKKYVPMKPLTKEQEEEYEKATHCSLCRHLYTVARYKVHDHTHLLGSYNNHYCNICNINMKHPMHLPIICHNMSAYDGHFIIQCLSKFKKPISIIPTSSEKYISFSITVDKIEIRFIDSYRFMATSLQKLVETLEPCHLIETSRHNPPDKLQLLMKKGHYPYEYIDNPSRFLETSLPPIEAFYNTLTESTLSPQEYDEAKMVWKEMNCQTLGDYHDVYLKLDVTLLTDVFETFRDVCYTNYLLDPLHSVTLPGYSWQSMLLHTQVEIELLTDYNIYMFIEHAIRGGLVQANKRFVQANNKYLENPLDYDKNAEESHILYVDVNNLYGNSLSQYLPLNNIKWSPNPLDVKWRETKATSEKGYLIEADVLVPIGVHNKLNDLPPLPLKEIPPGGKHPKLLATLHDKKRYIAHYRTMQQAEKLGLVVCEPNRILEFNQSPWLASYISLNTRLRQSSTSDFHKDLFKLMSNSVYGKCLEDQKKRQNIKLISDPDKFLKETNKINYTGFHIINSNMAVVTLARRKIILDRPIFVGQSVLDLSKYHVYDLYYEMIKKSYNDVSLVYTDTDSLCIHIKNDDIYQAATKYPEYFDFSNLPLDHPRHSTKNKQKLGLLKDEVGGRAIYQFIGLKPKLYAYRFSSDSTLNDDDNVQRDDHSKVVKKAKGVKKIALINHVTFNNYMEVLKEDKKIFVEFKSIVSKRHQVFTQSSRKVALTLSDDKRVLGADGNSTLAHGHYSTIISDSETDCSTQQ